MQSVIGKIKAILHVTGWRQERLAEELGVSQATVSRWISKGQDPKGSHRDAVASLYEHYIVTAPNWEQLLGDALKAAVASGVSDLDIMKEITRLLDEIERESPEDMKLVSEVSQRVLEMNGNGDENGT